MLCNLNGNGKIKKRFDFRATILAAISFGLIGCGSTPDCGSSEGQKLVISIIKENNLLGQGMLFINLIALMPQDTPNDQVVDRVNNAKLKLDEIVTLSKNKDTGTVQCRAKLLIDMKKMDTLNATVLYKIEKTSKGELYGTVEIQ